MTGPEIVSIVVNLGALPVPSLIKEKGKTTRAPAKSSQMDWSCMSCKSMMCLAEDFNVKLAKKEGRLPVSCPLGDKNFQSIKAQQNLLRANIHIKKIREKLRELEKELSELRKEESTTFVFRQRQLKEYYERITITRVTEQRKSKRITVKDLQLPNFRVTVAEVTDSKVIDEEECGIRSRFYCPRRKYIG